MFLFWLLACLGVGTNISATTITATNSFRIMQYNVEWLFIDYYANSDCPGNGCSWTDLAAAEKHLSYVSSVVNELKPDVLNLCEVEGHDELNMLVNETSSDYKSYLIQGSDSSTGQNVGLLSKLAPSVNLYRTEERVNYPIVNSKCGYTGAPGSSGVSKHYITEFHNVGGMNIAMIGLHFLAFPTDTGRCAQREAQAQVIQNVIAKYASTGFEIMVLGDFNDFDSEVVDANNNIPISHVLDIVKGMSGTMVGKYELFNIAANIPPANRFTDWWDKNGNCNSTSDEFSMIDHMLVTPLLQSKIVGRFIYANYSEFCGTFNSDHYPVVIDIEL